MKTHSVKTWPEWFNCWIWRNKSFEIRKDDREYQVGDIIRQREWDPVTQQYTGRVGIGNIVYVLRDFHGLAKGYCALECPFLKMEVKHGGHDEGELG